MEFREFIKNALTDIIQGINDAKNEEGGEIICPFLKPERTTATNEIVYDKITNFYHQRVDFDVAVTVENGNSGSGKASIKVFGIEAALGGDMTAKNSTISRIKFHVPIGLPVKRKNDVE